MADHVWLYWFGLSAAVGVNAHDPLDYVGDGVPIGGRLAFHEPTTGLGVEVGGATWSGVTDEWKFDFSAVRLRGELVGDAFRWANGALRLRVGGGMRIFEAPEGQLRDGYTLDQRLGVPDRVEELEIAGGPGARIRVIGPLYVRVDGDFVMHLGKYPLVAGRHAWWEVGAYAGVELRPGPLPDRDGDRIPDVHDQCVREPEEYNEVNDADGCPELDTDSDRVVDEEDRCPGQPEDRDGVADEDGCPDPNNDGDRMPDLADRCIEAPETENGWQDGDGCPDEPPAELAALEGPIPIAADGLERVAAVLAVHRGASVVMVVHAATDGERRQADADAEARVELLRATIRTRGLEDRVGVWAAGDSAPVSPRLRAAPEGVEAGWVELMLVDPVDAEGRPIPLWEALPDVPRPAAD